MEDIQGTVAQAEAIDPEENRLSSVIHETDPQKIAVLPLTWLL